MERRATFLGKSVEQLLADDRAALRQSVYPGPECLNPYEVEQFFSADIREERLAHVEKCPLCAALLDAARPTEDLLARFEEECRLEKSAGMIATPAAKPFRSPVWQPVIDAACVVGPILVAVLIGTPLGVDAIRNEVLKNLLLTKAQLSLPIVIVSTLVVLLLIGATAKWFKLGQGDTFQKFGGAAASGVFAALLVVYGAKLLADVNSTYSSMETAQSLLLKAIAEQHEGGFAGIENIANTKEGLKVTTSLDGKLLRATSAKFEGALVALGQKNETNVYWEYGKIRNIGTIYNGVLQRDGNGGVVVFTGSQKIAVESVLPERILRNGSRVLALVPENADKALEVLPVE